MKSAITFLLGPTLLMASQVCGVTMDIESSVANQLQTFNGVGLTAWSVDSDANVCMLGAAGERIRDSGEPLRTNDDSRHHIGSVTKSMTSSLMAILVYRGYFPDGWDTTLPQVIPEATNGTFANVTLRQIVSNSAGIDNFPSNETFLQIIASSSSPEETVFPRFNETAMKSFRRAAAVAAVQSTPIAAPGTAYFYSNWAFVTAGHIIEKATNVTWEEALAIYLFEPLGIDLGSDPFAYVGAPNNDVDPWGHLYLTPCDPSVESCDNLLVLGPAGTFSGPVAAMATYFAWHIACHNGEHTDLLSQEACREIHQPLDTDLKIPGTGWSYGYGWICFDDQVLGRVCHHNGSNLLNYYNVTLIFDRSRAYVSYSNAAGAPQMGYRQMVDGMVANLISLEASPQVCTDSFDSSLYISDPPTTAPSPSPTLAPTTEPTGDPASSAPAHALLLSFSPMLGFALVLWTMNLS